MNGHAVSNFSAYANISSQLRQALDIRDIPFTEKKLSRLSKDDQYDLITIVKIIDEWPLALHLDFENILNIALKLKARKKENEHLVTNNRFLNYTVNLLAERKEINKEVTAQESKWLMTFLETCPPKADSMLFRMIKAIYLDIVKKGITKENSAMLDDDLLKKNNFRFVEHLKYLFIDNPIKSFLSKYQVGDQNITKLTLGLADQEIEPVLSIFEDMEKMKVLTEDNVKTILNFKNVLKISTADKEYFFDEAKQIFEKRADIAKNCDRPLNQKHFECIVEILKLFSVAMPHNYLNASELYLQLAKDGLTMDNSASLWELEKTAKMMRPLELNKIVSLFTELFPKPYSSKNPSPYSFYQAKPEPEAKTDTPQQEEKFIPSIS